MNILKSNWQETKQHYNDWWKRKGLVIASWKNPSMITRRTYAEQFWPDVTDETLWIDPGFVREYNEYRMCYETFYFDTLPIANVDIGPGSLCLMLGCDVKKMTPGTVWYETVADINIDSHLTFDPENQWWKRQEDLIRTMVYAASGHYWVGCPDLVENLDILASLYGAEKLLFSLYESPNKVLKRIEEVNTAFMSVYAQIYALIKDLAGSSTFGAFQLWAPGRVAKVQCDISAMLSPAMFDQFVVPALYRQCEWLDYSMYHLDGTQALMHLDSLLKIESLDAIEWTPQAGLPQGGDPQWYPLYRKILSSGKSVQAIHVCPEEVLQLLDACGSEGFYLSVDLMDEHQVDDLSKELYNRYGYQGQ